MQLLETNQVLQKWGRYVVQQSRSNLTRGEKNYNKKLYKSIRYLVTEKQDATLLSFSMLDYGKFQDLGVKGKDPSKVSPNAKIKGQQAPLSPFRFRNKIPPTKPLAEWAKAKNVRLRDEKGKFKKGSYNTIGYIIAKNIYYRGISPSMFFTRPFERAFKKYDTDLAYAIATDIGNEIARQNNLENGN